MIGTIKSNLDLILIKEEIIEELSFWEDGSGAYMAIKPCQSILTLDIYKNIKLAIKEIEELLNTKAKYLMINKLPSGVCVKQHTDTLLGDERLQRWHLPIITNKDAIWWDEKDGAHHMPIGYWNGPVPYYIGHKVWNFGKEERIHLVVDLI